MVIFIMVARRLFDLCINIRTYLKHLFKTLLMVSITIFLLDRC